MNTFGTIFRLSIFGESHGPCIGVTLDGVPAGLPLSTEDFLPDLERRRPGLPGTTARCESDIPEILSGTCGGTTTGAPLTIIFRNEDTRPSDYSLFESIPRPGHADFTSSVKYNYFNDLRGSGHFSGRMTLALVAAGTVARKILDDAGGCLVTSRLVSVGGQTDPDEMDLAVRSAAADGDSVGGIVECRVKGLVPGVGEPFFDSVESMLAHAVFSIPGIRGIEFGDGFASASMRGSEHNDPFIDSSGHTSRNGAGGINGGISNGNELVFRAAVKPASSISRPQQTYDFVNECMTTLSIPGRHDSCIALRAGVVIEAVTAIVLADLVLRMKR